MAFGMLVYLQISFYHIFLSPIHLFIFLIGALGPFISSLLVYLINKETLGGLSGFLDKVKIIRNPRSIYLIPLFFTAHYGFPLILNNIHIFSRLDTLIYSIPMAFILLGSQEIGWRSILQPSLEKDRGFLKSTISTGLFWALWALPLVYIPGFFILPQFYLQFAIYLVGISFLLSTVYKVSGSIFYSIVLSTLIFSFYPIILLKQNYLLLALTILEIFISNIYREKFKILNIK